MLIYQRVSPLKKITGLIYHKRTRSTYTVYLFSPTLHTQGSETHTNATNETQGAWFHPGFGHLPTSAHDGAAVIVRLVRDCKIEWFSGTARRLGWLRVDSPKCIEEPNISYFIQEQPNIAYVQTVLGERADGRNDERQLWTFSLLPVIRFISQ